MKMLRSPFQGFTADHDQFAYWPMRALESSKFVNYAANGNTRDVVSKAGTVSSTTHPFDTQAPTQGQYFTGDVYGTNAPLDDHAWLHSNWSISFWYDMTGMAGGYSSATQTFIERSVTHTGSTQATRSHLRISYSPIHRAAVINVTTATTGASVNFSTATLPLKGMLTLTKEMVAASTICTYRVYHNDRLASTATTTSPMAAIGSSSSGRWLLGGSCRQGTGYTTFAQDLSGTINEVGIWAKTLNENKVRAMYANSVQTWDEKELIDSGNFKVNYKVRIKDANGAYQDFTELQGMNWVLSGEISQAVGEKTTASVTLHRRKGKFSDLSPLNTETEVTELIDVRRQVQILKAITPTMWKERGWEYELAFEGFIDSWDIAQDTVDLSLVDNNAPLDDAFIMEPKPYSFTSGKLAEEHQQQIIDDYEPELWGDTGPVIVIGYKGGKPQLTTLGGSAFSTLWQNSGFMLNYNDVSSGGVNEAVAKVVEQIGYNTTFQIHRPSQEARLITSAPRRDKCQIYAKVIGDGSGGGLITTYEPHMLSVGSGVSLFGTVGAYHDYIGTVATVFSPYKVGTTVDSGTCSAVVAGTNGTLQFSHNYELKPQDIWSVDKAGISAKDIRNHAVIKYDRNESNFSTAFTTIEKISGGYAQIDLPYRLPLKNIDPENDGAIMIEVGGLTGPDEPFNAKYSAAATNPRRLVTNELVPSPLIVGDTAAGGWINCLSQSYRSVISTATASMQKYGYRPVSIYEGSTGGIQDETAAGKLASALVQDLAEPTVSLSIGTRAIPVDLNDVLIIPADPKGRWTSELMSAVVSISESWSEGNAMASIGLRHSRPTNGVRWVNKIKTSVQRPELASGFKPNIIGPVSTVIAGVGQIHLRNPFVRGLSKVHQKVDRTEVYMGRTSDFVPSPNNRVASFRGEEMSLSIDENGDQLAPGQKYYIRMAARDRMGNLSDASGFGRVSGEGPLDVTPRYLPKPAAALGVVDPATTIVDTGVDVHTMILPVGQCTPTWASASLPISVIENGSDAETTSFDTFGNASAVSFQFQFLCPVDGQYLVNFHGASKMTQNTFKPMNLNEPYSMQVFLHRVRGGVTLPRVDVYPQTQLSAGTSPITVAGQVVVAAKAGDYLSLWHAFGPGFAPLNQSGRLTYTGNASVPYTHLSFQLLNER